MTKILCYLTPKHATYYACIAYQAVVCCRVSLSHEAKVVSLVRSTNRKAQMMAIDDGASDVVIIQCAHVRVGVSSQRVYKL